MISRTVPKRVSFGTKIGPMNQALVRPKCLSHSAGVKYGYPCGPLSLPSQVAGVELFHSPGLAKIPRHENNEQKPKTPERCRTPQPVFNRIGVDGADLPHGRATDVVVDACPDFYVSSRSATQVEAFRLKRVQTVARSTADKDLAVLKAFFNWSIAHRLAVSNPVRRVKLFHEDNSRLRYLTREEYDRLIEAVRR